MLQEASVRRKPKTAMIVLGTGKLIIVGLFLGLFALLALTNEEVTQ